MSEAKDVVALRHGPDGRPVFFADPAIDRFVSVMLNLASELWVQNERVMTLTALIEDKGLATREDLERTSRDAENDPARDEALRAYLERVLSPLRDDTRDPETRPSDLRDPDTRDAPQ